MTFIMILPFPLIFGILGLASLVLVHLEIDLQLGVAESLDFLRNGIAWDSIIFTRPSP